MAKKNYYFFWEYFCLYCVNIHFVGPKTFIWTGRIFKFRNISTYNTDFKHALIHFDHSLFQHHESKSVWFLIFSNFVNISYQSSLNFLCLCLLRKILQIFQALQNFYGEWWNFIDRFFVQCLYYGCSSNVYGCYVSIWYWWQNPFYNIYCFQDH